MKATIAVLAGDGIGPEVVGAAVQVLRVVGSVFGHEFTFRELLVGGAAIDKMGDPLPESTLAGCVGADAVLLGAVGGPAWDGLEPGSRPEQGLLRLRRNLGVYANIRPTLITDTLLALSPLKDDVARNTDLVIVRELTGGIYFGEHTEGQDSAADTCVYSREEVARVARVAFDLAKGRKGRVVSVDKANVLATSRLWRRVVTEVAAEYPAVGLDHMLVDAAAMRLVTRPTAFDVILTENMFGDILTDQAAALAGTLGMGPSASVGRGGPALFEPIHGSAPDIAGRGHANPYGTIFSVAMLLRTGLGLAGEADAVEHAAHASIAEGVLTPDVSPGSRFGATDVREAICFYIAADQGAVHEPRLSSQGA